MKVVILSYGRGPEAARGPEVSWKESVNPAFTIMCHFKVQVSESCEPIQIISCQICGC